jgi:hypothetical protein
MPPFCFVSSHSIDRFRPIGICIVMQGIEKDNHDNGATGMLLVLALNLSSIHSFQNALI